LLQGVALGLSLASVVLLWRVQSFRPKAVAMQGVGVFSRNVPAIVERASQGLTERAATGILAVGLSLQLAVLAFVPLGAESPVGSAVAGVVVGTAAVTLALWWLARELILSQRLVRVAAHPPTDEVTPLAFLFELDCERRGRSTVASQDLPADLRARLARRYRFARSFPDLAD